MSHGNTEREDESKYLHQFMQPHLLWLVFVGILWFQHLITPTWGHKTSSIDARDPPVTANSRKNWGYYDNIGGGGFLDEHLLRSTPSQRPAYRTKFVPNAMWSHIDSVQICTPLRGQEWCKMGLDQWGKLKKAGVFNINRFEDSEYYQISMQINTLHKLVKRRGLFFEGVTAKQVISSRDIRNSLFRLHPLANGNVQFEVFESQGVLGDEYRFLCTGEFDMVFIGSRNDSESCEWTLYRHAET